MRHQGDNNMAHNPLGMPGTLTAEDIERMNKNREKTYNKNKETADLVKMMKEIGINRFRQMVGQATLDQLKDVLAAEQRLGPIREKIRLQAKLKGDYPMCEKCQHWGGVQAGDTPCPYDNEKYEKNITFDTNELSQNPFPVEICEKFVWKKTD